MCMRTNAETIWERGKYIYTEYVYRTYNCPILKLFPHSFVRIAIFYIAYFARQLYRIGILFEGEKAKAARFLLCNWNGKLYQNSARFYADLALK